jgi:hypothetical protein
MEDLTLEEVKQLVIFYKQKATEVEFNLLGAQLKLNRFASAQSVLDENVSKKETSEKITK